MLCKQTRDNSFVVVKKLYQEGMSEEEKKESMNEIQVLSMLRHINIIQYYESFVSSENRWEVGAFEELSLPMDADSSSLMIVMEYANGQWFNDRNDIVKS